MGFDLDNVLSDERHHGSFQCAICQSLVGLDALVTTGCSHVFCKLCLETWLSRRADPQELLMEQALLGTNQPSESLKKCPTCNRDLSYQSHSHSDGRTKSMMVHGESIDVHPLSEVQPLAYRVLRRIKVKCPLHERHGCPWRGDYGDLQQHLVSATAHQQSSGGHDGTTAATNIDENCTSDSRQQKTPQSKHSEDFMETEEDDTEEMDMEPVSRNSADDTVTQNIAAQQQNRRSLAESFKEEANGKFSSGNYAEARDLYNKALLIMHDAQSSIGVQRSVEFTDKDDKKLVSALRANRAACHLKLKNYSECVDDCNVAIRLNPGYEKAYVRRSKAMLEMGKFEDAFAELTEGCRVKSDSYLLRNSRQKAKLLMDAVAVGNEQLNSGSYAAAKGTFGTLMLETSAIRVVLGAARADLGLGLTESALRLSLQVIRRDSRAAEGYEVRGRCMYLMGDFDSAKSLLRESLRLDPDCSGAKTYLRQCRTVAEEVTDSRKAVFTRNFNRAVELFTAAINHCQPLPQKAPLYSTLYSERAGAYLRCKNYDASLKDCALAIYAQEDCVNAWLIKAKAYHALGRHEEALDDMDKLMRKWGSGNSSIRAAFEKADFEVRKQKRPDFYSLFGVSRIASEMEIKKAYKKKALELHPDRWSGEGVTEEQRKKAEEDFKLLGAGLEILCDDFKKQLYDEGYDQEAIRDRVAAAQQAAHRRQGSYHHG